MTNIYSEVIIHVTFKCNMHCPKCTQRHFRNDYMLTRSQYTNILKRTKQQTHIESITLTGGEPTLWKDLRWSIQEAKLFGVKKVFVITNGIGRKALDYGCADKVFVSNYGAINRVDILRLKRGLGRRFRISNTCQLEWPLQGDKNNLPAICNCAHLFFAGDKVWPCQAAVYTQSGFSIYEDFVSLFTKQNPYLQPLCTNCISNLKARKNYQPGPTLELSLWNSRFMVLYSCTHKWVRLRLLLRDYSKIKKYGLRKAILGIKHVNNIKQR